MTKPSVREIFDTMAYGPAPEGHAEVSAWLARHNGRFGHWIDGGFTEPGAGFATKNPATGDILAEVTQGTPADLELAVRAARRAQAKWARVPGWKRAQVLYALARLVQKQSRLFAVLETMDNGKPIRESRDIDVPLVARHFYYHAGLAQLVETEQPGMEPLGVCGAVIPWNFPLLMLAWKVAPALAAGNAVVLKPAEWTPLTALLFAELSREAGLPRGLLNVVTGDGETGAALVAHPGVDKIAFTGSTEVGRKIRLATAGTGKSLTLELGGKSPYIVFDDADLDSAVEGLVDAIWFNQGQVCCAGSRLIVQEGVADRFHAKLKRRMADLRIGDPLDKCIDVGAMIDPEHLARVSAMVDACREGEVYRAPGPVPAGCFCPPTLITGLSSAHPLMQEEIFGPVLVSTTFRMPSEAVDLANNSRYGLAATVWTENVNLALEIAPRLKAGVVWINATNLFDAAAGFGGVRESGFGREGGWEGLMAYLRPTRKPRPLAPQKPQAEPEDFAVEGLDRTAKLFVGGRQVRPDGGYSRAVFSPRGKLLGHVGLGNRKDIRNAVEAAHAAKAWARSTGHSRAQILYYIGENLSARAAEFGQRLRDLTGKPGQAEVEASIRRLFTYAAWADKYDGAVKSVPMKAVALAMNEPVGVVGVLCPDEAPLLGLVSLMAPLIAMGNTCVLIPSEAAPLAATDFYQVLETSDLPAGVVNIVTGSHAELARTLAGHLDLDAVWTFSSTPLSALVEKESAGNLKRTWVNHARARDWSGPEGEGPDFLRAATEIKTIWVPYGEG